MPKGNSSYFGVRLGEALASGAGHISDALQRKYEMQRRAELEAKQTKQQEFGIQAQLASKGIRYDPTQPLDPSIFDPMIKEYQDKANLERRKIESDIGYKNKLAEFSGRPPSGFRYTATGDLEEIPGGPAFKRQDKSKALSQVSNVLSEISTYYKELQDRGAIPDVERGGISNIIAKTRSSALGQAAGGVVGTEEQSIRNKILSSRPLLINFIRQASNMGARGLDSEKELEFYLQAATDPTKDVQSNLAAIKRLDEAYGLSSMMTDGKPNPDMDGDNGGMIRVKSKATGKTGSMPQENFDPSKYDRI